MQNCVIAFKKDCDIFIEHFVSGETLLFSHFCTVWKQLNFHYVFYGHSNISELIYFCEEALIVIKKLFCSAKNVYERTGSIFLMYAMYFKQPVRNFSKFRMTLEEWALIKELFNNNEITDEVKLVLCKLLTGNAFRFTVLEEEHAFEYTQHIDNRRRRNEYSNFQRIDDDIEEDIQEFRSPTGILTALEIYEAGYNEMKETLNANDAVALFPQSSVISELAASFDSISKKLASIDDEFKIDRLMGKTSPPLSRKETEKDDGISLNIGNKRLMIKNSAFAVKNSYNKGIRSTPMACNEKNTMPEAKNMKDKHGKLKKRKTMLENTKDNNYGEEASGEKESEKEDKDEGEDEDEDEDEDEGEDEGEDEKKGKKIKQKKQVAKNSGDPGYAKIVSFNNEKDSIEIKSTLRTYARKTRESILQKTISMMNK